MIRYIIFSAVLLYTVSYSYYELKRGNHGGFISIIITAIISVYLFGVYVT